MTDFSTDLTPADAPDRSTMLDEGRGTTEAMPHKEEALEPDKKAPESRLDAIKRAAEDVEKAQAKAEPEPKPKPEGEAPAEAEPKPEDRPADEAKAPEPEKKTEQPADPRQRKQFIDPPSKFLPRAKELWHNVPHEVRSEMQRVMSEAEAETTQARESVREYEAVRPYAEMARQAGTSLDQALGRYVQMEQRFQSDPVNAFRALGSEMRMTPQQMIGFIASAYNVAPERLAQHMMQAPNEYTALARPQERPQQQPQQNGEVQQLKSQLEQLQANMAKAEAERTIIAPFAAANPRYYELEQTIAGFLQSAMIPQSLSPHDRLAAAYDLAVRISPSTKAPPASIEPEPSGEKADSRAGEDFGGTKSVRGAPATGVDTSSRRRGKMSRGDALDAAFADLGLAH